MLSALSALLLVARGRDSTGIVRPREKKLQYLFHIRGKLVLIIAGVWGEECRTNATWHTLAQREKCKAVDKCKYGVCTMYYVLCMYCVCCDTDV